MARDLYSTRTYRNVKFVEYLTKALHLLLHFGAALIPEASLIGLLKSNSCGFLKGRHATVADSSVCASYVLDQMLRANEVTNPPARSVEGLPSRTHRESALVKLRRQCSDPGKRNIVETVVDLVRKNDEIVLDTELADFLKLITRENLSYRVVAVVAISSLLRHGH